MRRHLGLLGTQLRASVLITMQYRADFLIALLMAGVWTVSALLPLTVLYAQRDSFAGWTYAEALVVVAWFNILKGVQGSLIQPSMQEAVAQIRKGTLDFVLLKPVDSQFLISTARFELREVSDVLVGLGILAYALARLDHTPSLAALATAALLLACGACILYAIWVIVMALAFVFVKVDNLTYLFSSLFDAARFPGTMFRGTLAIVFTFVLPLIVMTTYPALALLDRLAPAQLGIALGMAALALFVSRQVWRRSIRRYTSFGG